MYTRLDDVPVYQLRDGKLSATHFNHVQVALKRLGDSIRFPIPELKHLDLILQKNEWIIVDRVLNDYPIVAWTDFETGHRDDLHSPIKCKIRFYHAYASLVMRRTLEAMELMLGEQLAEMLPDDDDNIIPFKPDKQE